MVEELQGDDVVTEKTCGICLEDSKDPLNLPCGHSFCDGCLGEWRSPFGVKQEMRRKCPICRARIPPSKQMVETLFAYRAGKQKLEDDNKISTEFYRGMCHSLKQAEERVGADWDGVTVLEDNNDKPPIVMPVYVRQAIRKGDIKSVLRWINANRAEDRVNATASAEFMAMPALCIAAGSSGCNQLALMTILLQLGANVDARDNTGCTALGHIVSNGAFALGLQARGSRLLLSWGASFFPGEFAVDNQESSVFLKLENTANMNLPLYWSPSSEGGGARSSIYRHDLISTARRVSRTNIYPSANSTR